MSTQPALLAYPINVLVDCCGVPLRAWNATTRRGQTLTLFVGAVGPRGRTRPDDLQTILAEMAPEGRGGGLKPLSYCCERDQLVDLTCAAHRDRQARMF